MNIPVDSHPLLDAAAFTTTFPVAIGAILSPGWLVEGLSLDFGFPVARSEETRKSVRDMLRHGGYKPTGRGKPASEYLVRAAGEGKLSSINPAVDACNVVSLHSGLPISVVDLDRASPPFRLGVAESGASYVFNPSGQEIKVGGLLCLHDADGPCANAVKDAQRTKTDDATRHTLSIVWGSRHLEDLTARVTALYRGLFERMDVSTTSVSLVVGDA